MRSAVRSLGVVLLAIAGVVALGWSATMATLAQLLLAAFTTALIMGGTGTPVPPQDYIDGAVGRYITPGFGAPDAAVGVITPEQFWPVNGNLTFDQSVAKGVTSLNGCIGATRDCISTTPVPGGTTRFVVFGYSQSVRVATIEKRNLIADPMPTTSPSVSFFLIGNPNRPNGGILERFNLFNLNPTIPILGVTFDGATPTNSCDANGQNCQNPTIDVARQYAGWEDFPENPVNVLADANAIAGIVYLHGDYFSSSVNPALYQGTMGDTNYYLSPTGLVPILMPLQQIGIPEPILDAINEPTKVMIEWAYNRNANPGTPTTANIFYIGNPIAKVVNLAVSIPTGIDNGIQDVTGTRPLGTTRPTSPFGVGGPELPQAPKGTPESIPLAGQSMTALDNNTGDNNVVDNNVVDNNTMDSNPPVNNMDNKGSTQNLGSTQQTEQPTKPVIKPRPLRDLVRNSIGADLPKQPKAVRQNGDGPLQKVVNALTGQKPKPKGDDKPAAKPADKPGGKAA